MPTSSGFQIGEILTSSDTNKYLLRPYDNCIINGSMNIAQRSTSVAGISSGDTLYSVDRWKFGLVSAGTWTQSQIAIPASEQPAEDGARQAVRLLCTTANASPSAGSYAILYQVIEGFNTQQFAKGTVNAKPFALSFWVRANLTGTYVVELFDHTNGRKVSASYSITSSNVWQKVRLIFPADTTGAIANSTAAGLSVYCWLVAGSNYASSSLNTVWGTPANTARATGQSNLAGTVNNFFDMTAVQLEPNSVCTPFQNRLYGEELALCQRYFYKINGTSQYEPVASAGVNQAATNHWRTQASLPVPMRKALTTADMTHVLLAAYDGAGIVIVTSGAIVGHAIGSTMLSIDWSSGGSLTTGRPVVVLTNPYGSASYFQVSAEL